MRFSILLRLLATPYIATASPVSSLGPTTDLDRIEAQTRNFQFANTKRGHIDITIPDPAWRGSVLKTLPKGTMVIDMDGEVGDLRQEPSSAFKVLIPTDYTIVIGLGGSDINHTVSITDAGQSNVAPDSCFY